MEIGDAYTAALSNAVSLRLDDIAGLLREASVGDLPASNARLRLFLHEGTHHTSFYNAYGWASAGLSSSLISPGLVGPLPRNADGLLLPVRDLLVLRWMQRVFQPLIEGLAVFAEHDIVWSENSLASQPLLNAASLYFARDAYSSASNIASGEANFIEAANAVDSAITASINDRLKRARSSRYWIAEKLALLRQPLLGSDGGPPYLLGYLAVKRAFLKTRRKPAALSEPDNFLLLMISHWFCDEDLAQQMLSVNDLDPTEVQYTLHRITESFQDKWEELYKSPRTVAANSLSILSRLDNGNAHAPMDLQFLLGTRALTFSLARAPRFFKHRLALRHGIQKVALALDTLSRTASVRAVDGQVELFSCPLVPNADVTAQFGTVELVRSSDGRMDALVVLGGDGLLAAWDLQRRIWNPADLVEALDDLPSGDHARDAELAVQHTHWDEAWEEPGLAELYEHQLGQATETRDMVHLQIAFPGARSGERERISTLLGTCGFASLFDEPNEMLKLARYSLVLGGRGASLADAASALGTSPEALYEEIRSINARAQSVLGLDLFEEDGEWLTSAV